jgi:hypothetical protein
MEIYRKNSKNCCYCVIYTAATKVHPTVTATKTFPSQPTQDLSPNTASKDTDFNQGKGKPNLRVVIPPKSDVRVHFDNYLPLCVVVKLKVLQNVINTIKYTI